MRDWMIGQGAILYVFLGCLVVGVLSAFIANHGYKRLIKESEIMGNTQNRLLKYIKLKFGSYYKLNMRPQDTRALTKHYMYKYKIGFMNVLSWIKLSKLSAGVAGVAAVICLLWMQTQGMTAARMVSMIGCSVICIALIYIQHRLYDFPEKQNMLEWYLMDYLENFLKNKIESARELGAGAMRTAPEDKSGQGQSIRKAQEAQSSPAAAAKIREEKIFPEAAASRLREPSYKKPEEQSFSVRHDEGQEDEIDARIVEDILKEFLN